MPFAAAHKRDFCISDLQKTHGWLILNEVTSVQKVSPLRRSAFEGVVSHLRFNGSGSVGNDIVFSPSTVTDGAQLRQGSKVFGEMVETRSKWRALSVRLVPQPLLASHVK